MPPPLHSAAIRLMSRGPAANFHYDFVDGAHDQFLRNRPMVCIRDDDLMPPCREPDELRLYFVNPHLLIRRSLFIHLGISEIKWLTRRQHNQGKVSNPRHRRSLG